MNPTSYYNIKVLLKIENTEYPNVDNPTWIGLLFILEQSPKRSAYYNL